MIAIQPNRFHSYALLTIAPLLMCLSGCKDNKEAQAPPTPAEVEFVTVEQKDVPIYMEWVGTLDGDVNATISAQVSGYLTNRAYMEGRAVTNGQVLFQIDSAPFDATLSKARAALAQAVAVKANSKLDVERYTPLAKTDAISQKELDNAIEADLAADAQIDGAKATVQQAELNLGFTTIRSPIDGVAGLAKAQVGDLVGPGTGALTTVSKINPIRAYFSLSEQLLYQVMARRVAAGAASGRGTALELQLVLAGGEVYPEKGHTRFSDNKVDVKTGTVQIVGEFPNPKSLLNPGMFARVRALVGVETNALLVPQRAVTEMQGRFLVAVVGAGNKVAVLPVSAGERVGSEWIIQSKELKAGDRVVAEGVQKVRDGAVVNPHPFGTSAKTAAASEPKKQ
jgi:membrane fusion protein (multidrug efflux system)